MAIKVTVPVGCNVGACAARENSRYAINGVLVKVGKPGDDGKGTGWAVATDGRRLSCTRVEFEGEPTAHTTAEGVIHDPLKGALVPVQCLPSAVGRRDFTLNGQCEKPGKKGETVAMPYVEGSFPPFADVLPDVNVEDHICIGLNADLLAGIQAAVLGGDGPGVVLFVPRNPKKPIGVLGANGVGVVMPVGVEGDKFAEWTRTAVELGKTYPNKDAGKPKKSDPAPVVAKVEQAATDEPNEKGPREQTPDYDALPPKSKGARRKAKAPHVVAVPETPAPSGSTLDSPETVALVADIAAHNETVRAAKPVVRVALVPAPVPQGDAFTIRERATKGGKPFWCATPAVRVPKAEWDAQLAQCKDAGGWWHGAFNDFPAGWSFWKEDAARAFVDSLTLAHA